MIRPLSRTLIVPVLGLNLSPATQEAVGLAVELAQQQKPVHYPGEEIAIPAKPPKKKGKSGPQKPYKRKNKV